MVCMDFEILEYIPTHRYYRYEHIFFISNFSNFMLAKTFFYVSCSKIVIQKTFRTKSRFTIRTTSVIESSFFIYDSNLRLWNKSPRQHITLKLRSQSIVEEYIELIDKFVNEQEFLLSNIVNMFKPLNIQSAR